MTSINYDLSIPAVTDLRATSAITVNSGVKLTDYKLAASSNGVDASAASFQINIPQGHVLAPDLTLRFPVSLEVEVKNDKTAEVDLSNSWAFSNFAIHRLMENLSVTINSSTITRSMQNLVNLYAPIADGSTQNPSLSAMFPCPDFVSDYKNLTATDSGSAPFGNPLHSLNQYYTPRRNGDEVVSDGFKIPTKATKTITIKGTLQCTIPFEFFGYFGGAPGLANISSFQISCTMRNRPQDLIKIMPGADVTILSVRMPSFADVPQCLYGYSAPPDVVEGLIKEAPQTYPYTEYRVQTTSAVGVKEDGKSITQITSNSVNLGTIPSKIVVLAVPVDENNVHAAVSRPDHYGVIDRLTISFNGNNVFTELSSYDLYKMSCRNGLKYSYPMWLSAGAPVIIDLEAGDLGTDNAHVGQKMSGFMQCNAYIKNMASVQKDFRLLVVCCEDAYLTLSPGGGGSTQSGIQLSVETAAALDAGLADAVRYSPRYLGAGFWSNLWGGIKKYAPRVVGAVPAIAKLVGDAASVVKGIRGGGPSVVGGAKLYGSGVEKTVRKAGGISDSTSRIK